MRLKRYEVLVAGFAVCVVVAGLCQFWDELQPNNVATKAIVPAAPKEIVVETRPTKWVPVKFVSFKSESGQDVMATGPNFPSSASNDSAVGFVAWNNPGNVLADDSSDATISNNDSESNYLKTSGYGFALGSNQVIDGIAVTVNRKCTGGCLATHMRLLIGGVISGSDRAADDASWTPSYVSRTFGGPTEKWGLTPTYADINDPGFGAAFAAAMSDSIDTASIDFIAITVYHHSESLPDAVGSSGNPSASGILIRHP